jgi:multicomponent Na+:H+ antiporter subunit D
MNLLQHLPALQVLMPLLAAPVIALMPSSRAARIAVCIATLWTFGIAVALLITVYETIPLHYAMGNWQPPIGIEYRVDLLSAVMLVLIAAIGMICAIYAQKSLPYEIAKEKRPLFYAVFLLCLAGLLGMVISNDVFNIYVFLEIASLASYTLIGMGRQRKALVAGFNYLVLGTVGATFLLIGIGLLYMMTGTLNITDLATLLGSIHELRTVKAAFAFIAIGLAFKMALFPLHSWLPAAYSEAPSFISAFLSGTFSKVILYVFIRFCCHVFGIGFIVNILHANQLLILLSCASMLFGSVLALRQTNVKRLLAYSSIAQIGTIMLGISLFSSTGMESSLILLVNHALIKSALFMATGCIIIHAGSAQLQAFRGAGRTMPWAMGGFTLASASLIGIPLTGGFISKWLLLSAAIEQQLWSVVIVMMLSSLLSLFYMWRIVETIYFAPYHSTPPPHKKTHLSMVLMVWIPVIGTIIIGCAASPTLELATRISHYLLGRLS